MIIQEKTFKVPEGGEITVSCDPEGKYLKVEFIKETKKKYYKITITNPPAETGRTSGLIMQGF